MLLCRVISNFQSVLTLFFVLLSIFIVYESLLIIRLIRKRFKLNKRRLILKNSILACVGCEFRHYLLIFVFKTTKCSPNEVFKGSFGVCPVKSDCRFSSSWADLSDIGKSKSDRSTFLNDLELYFGLQPVTETAYYGFNAENRDTFVIHERNLKVEGLGTFFEESKRDLSSFAEMTETPARMQPSSKKSQGTSAATENLSKKQVSTTKKHQ
uniref:Uncharacterized protein n=1 Tax=Romanomermis culicivorax TaxID=13658 RepID=A0A915I9G0_ROMCU